jgi:hypothetical protein
MNDTIPTTPVPTRKPGGYASAHSTGPVATEIGGHRQGADLARRINVITLAADGSNTRIVVDDDALDTLADVVASLVALRESEKGGAR